MYSTQKSDVRFQRVFHSLVGCGGKASRRWNSGFRVCWAANSYIGVRRFFVIRFPLSLSPHFIASCLLPHRWMIRSLYFVFILAFLLHSSSTCVHIMHTKVGRTTFLWWLGELRVFCVPLRASWRVMMASPSRSPCLTGCVGRVSWCWGPRLRRAGSCYAWVDRSGDFQAFLALCAFFFAPTNIHHQRSWATVIAHQNPVPSGTAFSRHLSCSPSLKRWVGRRAVGAIEWIEAPWVGSITDIRKVCAITNCTA